jgi:hypothetical protein
MPAKVCPRCGAQYPNLKSTTCPECFAVLVTVDDATAEEMAAARAEVEQTPEFQAVKAADDERFKLQSFGACLTVVVISVLTLILGIVLIVSAGHHRNSPPAPNSGGVEIGKALPNSPLTPPELGVGGQSSELGAQSDPLTTLPVAAATLNDVFPTTLGPYQRLTADQSIVVTGTLTHLFHGVYALPDGKPLDVYALPAGQPTTEQNQFRLGLTLAAQVGGQRPLLFFATEYWHFGVLAAPSENAAPAAFRDAVGVHFRGD